MSFILKTFGKSVILAAENEGVRITCELPIEWLNRESYPPDATYSSVGLRMSYDIPSILEMGLGETIDHTVFIAYSNFPDIPNEELRLLISFSEPSQFLLKIDRTSDIGRPNFFYKYQFILGTEPVFLQRIGYYLKRSSTGQLFHLDDTTYSLIEAMDTFNDLPPEAKELQTSWLTFATVKGLSMEANVTLESTLQKNDVILPSEIGLELYEDSNGALTFIPTSRELDGLDFRTVFERNDDAQLLYSIDRPGMGKLRIVFTEKQREVLKRMKSVQRVTGSRKEILKKDPGQIFDGIAGDVELPYGDRVIGIGEFEFVSVPKAETDDVGMTALWSGEDSGGENELKTIKEPDTDIDKPSKKTLLIETHDETVRAAYLRAIEKSKIIGEDKPFERPHSLRENISLHKHQEAGVRWLQTCSRIDDRTGVLLADDMGVGKTIQVLTYLAWAIETGIFPDLSRSKPPFRPILIVAPLILLETETWENEIKKFFSDNGDVFGYVLPLYGPTLKGFRRRDAGGREEIVGKPILDLDRIQKHQVVITNYEAVRDYEFSFAYFPNGKSLWSIVVTDEAHEYKTPNSKISHAMKAIKPDFRIACTGTPVENRLLDLWNIFDTVQPGLLGAAKEFSNRYEGKADSMQRNKNTIDLKTRLLYQQPHSFLLRRNKNEVLELPPKHEHRCICAMSVEEIAQHSNLQKEMNSSTKTIGKLGLIQQFAKLYQHPCLLQNDGDDLSTETLISQSSKLREVINLLGEIRSKKEKAIIFCRHKAMQRILARVLSEKYGIPVQIMNGDTRRGTSLRKSGVETRQTILDQFKNAEGFNIVILSPFVAGVGLTIVEANHVIHYGRWWNPAVESQATDRAYRISQTKEVHVYFPILEDQSGQIASSFDQLLHDLMERKKQLAASTLQNDEFLSPLEQEEAIGMEVYTKLEESLSS